MECICSDIEHIFNIILGKETGTTFPISIQDREVPKLRNASGRDMKMHGVMTTKFKMGNTIFTQEFVVCDNLVRPIIIGRFYG